MVMGGITNKQNINSLIDFQMSKVFGLDWEKYSYKRMNEFIFMISCENEAKDKAYRQNKK